MADRPGSFRNGPKVSRHTMVLRKAREEDAERLAESDHALRADGAVTSRREISPSVRSDAGERHGGTSIHGRRVSGGKTVVVQHESGASARLTVSTRLSGRQAASVRVTGGDTIIRYQSGDMVIKRGARRQRLRRQVLWAYALGYILLFGSFGYFLLTGTHSVAPDDFVQNAFARRHGTDILDLERAAFEAMRGNRTPAEVRLAQPLSFYDENKDLIRIESGSRLTLLTAAKLGQAIIKDSALEPSRRTFSQPLRLYKETYLATLNWPYWLTLYNSLGFFLMLALFLWRPLVAFLGTAGKKTAVGLHNARTAQEEAAAYRMRYRQLAADIEERRGTLRQETEKALEKERKDALEEAGRTAQGISGGIVDALEREAEGLSAALGEKAAAEACDRARGILESRLGQREHDAAIDELIAGITGMGAMNK